MFAWYEQGKSRGKPCWRGVSLWRNQNDGNEFAAYYQGQSLGDVLRPFHLRTKVDRENEPTIYLQVDPVQTATDFLTPQTPELLGLSTDGPKVIRDWLRSIKMQPQVVERLTDHPPSRFIKT